MFSFYVTAVNLRFILITPVTGLCEIVLLQYKIKVLSTVICKCHIRREKLDTFCWVGKYGCIEWNTRRVGVLVTHALQPHLNFCAALLCMHLAALHLEQCAVSC